MIARSRPADAESGMILVNVLVILALASSVVLVMISFSEMSIRRSQRFSEAAQAEAYAFGGESSAIVALRQDAITGPSTDNLREPWAQLAQRDTAIANGRFNLVITDAQARFNINTLVTGGGVAEGQFKDIVATLGISAMIANRIVSRLRLFGSISNLMNLREIGIGPIDLQNLSRLVTALPGPTTVNINTADETLIGIMLANRVAAHSLVTRRDRQGLLRPLDVSELRVLLPPGLGFTSDHFLVLTEVTVADTKQKLETLLERRRQGRNVDVVAIRRKR